MAGDHAAHMGGVEQDVGSDLVGDPPNRADRVREEIEAAADGDQLRPEPVRVVPAGVAVDRVLLLIAWRGMRAHPVQPGVAGPTTGALATDRPRRPDERVRVVAGGPEPVPV